MCTGCWIYLIFQNYSHPNTSLHWLPWSLEVQQAALECLQCSNHPFSHDKAIMGRELGGTPSGLGLDTTFSWNSVWTSSAFARKASPKRWNWTFKNGWAWGKEGMEGEIRGAGPAGAEIMHGVSQGQSERVTWWGLLVLSGRRSPWQRRHFQRLFQEVCKIGACSGGEGSMFPAEGTGRA